MFDSFSRTKVGVCAVISLLVLFTVLGGSGSSQQPRCQTWVDTSGDGGTNIVISRERKSASTGQRFPAPREEYHVPPPKSKVASFEPKYYVITGGAGFIGSQLGYHLWSLGHEVTLVDNMAYGYRDNLEIPGEHPRNTGKLFGRFVNADVRDHRIFKFLKGADVVFHFAALTALPVCQSQPLETMEVNVAGTANVLEAVRLFGIGRLIFASTSAVYESNTEAVLTEDLPVDPKLLYSLSKLQSEQLIRSYESVYSGLNAVVLRFFNVYGPHQDFRRQSPPLTSYIVRELLNKRSPILHSSGKQERDYVFVDDLLRLVMMAAENPKAIGQTINVASGTAIKVNEIYSIVAKLMLADSVQPKYNNASSFWSRYPVLFEGHHKIKIDILEKEVNKYTLGSFKKAKDLLGWSPQVTMAEGLARMVSFVKKHQATKQRAQRGGGW